MEWSTTSLREFWALVVEVWDHGVYGIDLPQILAALVVFLFFLMLRSLFTRYVLGALSRMGKRSDTARRQPARTAARAPAFVPVLMGIFFATRLLNLGPEPQAFVYNINRSLVAFTLFWALFRISTPAGIC